jgi:hypothetical protein
MASPRPSILRSGMSVALAVVALLLVPVRVAAQDPVMITGAPALPQTALVGQMLTPTAGSWEPAAAVPSYQWQRCDATGSPPCEALGAATTAPATYTVTESDAGRSLSVVLTVSDGVAAPASAPSNGVSVLQAPSSTSLPTVEGTARDGLLLHASTGGWLGSSPLVFAYQWQRCSPSGASCIPLPGATATSYLLSGTDVGLTVRVQVTASNAAGMTAVSSAPTGVVAPAPLVNLGLPEIVGPAEIDRSLTALPGIWTPSAGVEFLFRWLRCEADRSRCEAIPGANAGTYRVRLGDAGSRLRVRVTAIADAGAVSAESAQTAVVPSPPGTQDFAAAGPPPAATPSGPGILDPFPRVRIKGFYTPRGARLQLVTVKGPPGAQIRLACHGRGCPYRRRALPSRPRVRLRSLERFHRSGTRIVIRVTSPQLIGKYTRIIIRRGREPARRDRCLLPGGTKPVACPAG